MMEDSYLSHLIERVNHWYTQQQRQRDNPNTDKYFEATDKLNTAQQELDAYIKRKDNE